MPDSPCQPADYKQQTLVIYQGGGDTVFGPLLLARRTDDKRVDLILFVDLTYDPDKARALSPLGSDFLRADQ